MIYIISKSSFFLYLIVCIIFLYCKSIKLNYYAINDQFNLKLYIGTPPEESFIPIDLNLDFSWITSQIFSPTNSKTSHFQNVMQINDGTDIKKEIVEIIDQICVAFTGAGLPPKDCFSIKEYSFYWNRNEVLIKQIGKYGLSFGYKIQDRKTSIVHRLSEDKEIHEKQFSFLPFDKSKTNIGKIQIGPLPQEEINKYKYKGECQINKEHSFWSCELNTVILNNITYINREIAYFQTKQKETLIPQRFLDFLNYNGLQPFLGNSNCTFIHYYKADRFQCFKNVLNELGSITFVFRGVKIEIDIKDFFKCVDNVCDFLFIKQDDKYDQWVFGTSFLNNIAITFNYDQSSISFYSNNPITPLDPNIKNKGYLKTIEIIICISLLISTIMMYLMKKMIE